jgi:excisionase family DNA binding protein
MAPDMTVQDRSSPDPSRDSTAQDRSVFVSVAEAARLLGVSSATVKRRIRDGTLEAEPLSRPQGIEYRVKVMRELPAAISDDLPPLMALASNVPAPISDVAAPLVERGHSKESPFGASVHGITHDLTAALTAATGPLVERLTVQDATIAAQGATIQAQAAQIGDLREERGRLTAELERAEGAVVALCDELATERETKSTLLARAAAETAPPPFEPSSALTAAWVRWRWLLVLLAVASIVAGILLFVPR